MIWVTVSQNHYGKKIHRGDSYNIYDKQYTVPDLELIGEGRILHQKYLYDQWNVLKDITIALKALNIEYWVSGGTLLGFERHKTFIPWDDDIDVHTKWSNREYMFSNKFNTDLREYNLEAIFLPLASIKRTTVVSAAVRLRRINTITPVCDVFFVHEKQPGVFGKVNSWAGNHIVYNNNELWGKDLLFPIITRSVDGLELCFPNDPIKVLQKQYGQEVMNKMHARNVLFSHWYPFKLFQFIWKSH